MEQNYVGKNMLRLVPASKVLDSLDWNGKKGRKDCIAEHFVEDLTKHRRISLLFYHLFSDNARRKTVLVHRLTNKKLKFVFSPDIILNG